MWDCNNAVCQWQHAALNFILVSTNFTSSTILQRQQAGADILKTAPKLGVHVSEVKNLWKTASEDISDANFIALPRHEQT